MDEMLEKGHTMEPELKLKVVLNSVLDVLYEYGSGLDSKCAFNVFQLVHTITHRSYVCSLSLLKEFRLYGSSDQKQRLNGVSVLLLRSKASFNGCLKLMSETLSHVLDDPTALRDHMEK